MEQYGSDDSEYALFTFAGAQLNASVVEPRGDLPQIRLIGNRRGMASLANVLLWLVTNNWRREFLSITDLSFIRRSGDLSLSIRIAARDDEQDFGRVLRLDQHCQYEWELTEEELQRLALQIHALAANPVHDYDDVPLHRSGDATVWLQLSDTE